MFKYQLDIERIQKFLKSYPTPLHRRRVLAKKDDRFASEEEVQSFIGTAVQSAGENFLERVRQEIYDNRPQWEKDAIQKDLASLAKGEELTEDNAAFVSVCPRVRPELSDEYLISLGRPDLTVW